MVDRRLRTPDWDRLTHDPQKLRIYPSEFEYRRVWEDLLEAFGERAEERLLDFTILVLKPECFRRRVTAQILDFIERNGFTIVDSALRHVPVGDENYIWRYQWNTASMDRLRLLELKNRGESSAILLLRRPTAGSVPASVHLTSVKGSSAFLDRRKPDDLRSILAIPNRALTFIHCPDEPADVLREFVSLFPDGERLVQKLRDTDPSSAAAAEHRASAIAFESTVPRHAVDFAEVAARRGLDADVDTKRQLRDIRPLFGALDDPQERWDFITYAAALLKHDRDDEGPVISTRFLPRILETWSAPA